jgi:xylulose-5-phosphate/fructose-6-phosphate phosphoketolase
MDRFTLALDAIRRVPRLKSIADKATQRFTEAMQRHKLYVSEHGEDMPEVAEWRWSPATSNAQRA